MLSMYMNTDLLNPASQPNDSATESLEALVSLEVFLRRGWFGFFCLWANELLFMELFRWWERIFGIGEALQIFSFRRYETYTFLYVMQLTVYVSWVIKEPWSVQFYFARICNHLSRIFLILPIAIKLFW